MEQGDPRASYKLLIIKETITINRIRTEETVNRKTLSKLNQARKESKAGTKGRKLIYKPVLDIVRNWIALRTQELKKKKTTSAKRRVGLKKELWSLYGDREV